MNIEAFHKLTYGLYVVCSVKDSKLNGYISNTVFQVTSEPAQLAIACSKNNYTAEMIMESEVFSVSALKKDTRPGIIGTFGFKSGLQINKFESFSYKTGKTGAPILTDDTISWFECNLLHTVDLNTHLLFIGKVTDYDLLDVTGEPLTYAYYREVKKGKAPKNAPTFIDIEAYKNKISAVLFECTACGHIYDPAKGDPGSGIAPGTRFEDIPENWVCPVCGASKSDFIIKTK